MTAESPPSAQHLQHPRRTQLHGRARVVRTAVTAVIAAVGLLLAGAGLGRLIWPPTAVEVRNEIVAPQEAQAHTEAEVMPDVVGLPEQAARRALADSGITAAITTGTTMFAGESGRVVTQDPAPGADVVDEVTLTLSEPVIAPSVTGLDAAAAREQLSGLGAAALLNFVVTAAAEPGVVIASSSIPGDPLPEVVTLDVADPGSAREVAELPLVESSGCRSSTVTIDSDRTSGFVCDGQQGESPHLEVDLQGKAVYLSLTLAIADADEGGRAIVAVRADDRTVRSVEVGPTPVSLRLDLGEAQTLVIQADFPTGLDRVRVLIGSLLVHGDEADLAELTS